MTSSLLSSPLPSRILNCSVVIRELDIHLRSGLCWWRREVVSRTTTRAPTRGEEIFCYIFGQGFYACRLFPGRWFGALRCRRPTGLLAGLAARREPDRQRQGDKKDKRPSVGQRRSRQAARFR